MKNKRKYNKNNHVIISDIYTGYIQSKICPVRMPEKMIDDLRKIAKSKGLNLSEMIRQELLNKYHLRLLELNENKKRIMWHGDIEDMPLDVNQMEV